MRLRLAIGLSLTGMSLAHADVAGDFDYYILALSWNSGWCEIEGERKGAPQCHDQPREGFVLHGLWPQYKNGWPEYCSTSNPNPSRRVTNEKAEIYGSAGSAWHQWNKHGRCTGLNFQDYYDISEKLTEEYQAPEIFFEIEEPLNISPSAIEEAMEETYPSLNGDTMAIICKQGIFQEIRICLDKEFEPTDCLGRAAEDCRYSPEFLPSFDAN